jgi:DNA-binding HxlR family transcriptional regulator
VEYSLSDLGRSIEPILDAMYFWGESYLTRDGRHVGCTMKPHNHAS